MYMTILYQIFNKFIKYSLLLPAECLYTFPRKYARYANPHPVQPLKGLGETRAAAVSYRASVPAGHAGCWLAMFHRALSPYGEILPSVTAGSPSVRISSAATSIRLNANNFLPKSLREAPRW